MECAGRGSFLEQCDCISVYHISDVHWHPGISGSKDSDDPISERHSTWQLPAQPGLLFLPIPGIKQPAGNSLIVVTIYLRNGWNGGWDVTGFSVRSPFPKPSQWKTILFLHCPDIQLPSMGHTLLWQGADKKFVHWCMKWKWNKAETHPAKQESARGLAASVWRCIWCPDSQKSTDHTELKSARGSLCLSDQSITISRFCTSLKRTKGSLRPQPT